MDECFHLKIKNKATMEKTAQNYVKDVNCLKISYFISLFRKASTLAVKMSFAIDLLSIWHQVKDSFAIYRL